jgi:two-component system sensor histidine kinase SenX3
VTDVRHVVDLCVTGHSASAVEKGLALVQDTSEVEGADVFANADPTDVTVALDNLLDNAVSYTERGSITIELRATDVDVQIAVVDTGIGIPEADQDRVFERFYRVDSARTRTTGGTGLGLSLVRHAVQRSNGRVTLDSAVGSGTRVTLTFARAR